MVSNARVIISNSLLTYLVDWVQDAVRERYRQSTRTSDGNLSWKSYLYKLYEAGQAWLVVSLVGRSLFVMTLLYATRLEHVFYGGCRQSGLLMCHLLRTDVVFRRSCYRIECDVYRDLYRMALGHKARTLFLRVVVEPKVLLLGRRIGR